MSDNFLLKTDSYKATHFKQYAPGTRTVYSYFESRGGKFSETTFALLQYVLKRHFEGPRITPGAIDEAIALYTAHFGTGEHINRDGWTHVWYDHGGKLPLSIRAVPEGTSVPTHNVLMTVENTCPRCFWLTNYAETLLVQTWFPTTVATLSREIKRVILNALKRTGDPGLIDFKLHDFGFRGVSSCESAAIGGAAHLINFKGTDTIPALTLLRDYYQQDAIAGFSIPASEHSTITSWGQANETDAFRNMLTQYPTGLIACVSDSFDIWKACSEKWGGELRDKVLERDGCLVVRPDSGDPPKVVIGVLYALGEAFGFSHNKKGYKVLNPKIRVIQGDGVNLDSITEILRRMGEMGWSADNIAFGMGGALLQKLDRDTQKFAFKCSYVNGAHGHGFWERDVFKQPVTDPGKDSKRGKLALVKRDDGFHTQPQSLTPAGEDQLVEVFRDGELTRRWRLDEVRGRAEL